MSVRLRETRPGTALLCSVLLFYLERTLSYIAGRFFTVEFCYTLH